MSRRRALSGVLALVSVAALADRSALAEPPMVRAPGPQVAQPAPRPSAVTVTEPRAIATLQAARQSASSVSAHQVNADNAHGYLFNCFISNAGPDSVAFNGQTVAAMRTWFSTGISQEMAPGWMGGLNGMMIYTTPPTTTYNAVFSLTRCEVTPYTVPQPPNPSGGH